jgi:ketosteroid isomerase-like protein
VSNAETVIVVLGSVFSDEETEIDKAFIERMIEALTPITAEDVVMTMRGSDDTFIGTYEGFAGLRAGWADWLDSFDRVRFQFEGVEQVGDNVLTYGRQIGTTRHGGVQLEQPSAAVWKFRDGLISQVEFHLDRERAAASARDPLSDEA